MPRYFFNTRIGNELILDPEGEVLRDADHAWHAARTTIREILKTDGEQRRKQQGLRGHHPSRREM